MIRIEKGREVKPGIFEYRICSPRFDYSGFSRQVLLDACRVIKRMGGDSRELVCMFREGRDTWDARCSVGWGAAHTVKEPNGENISFAKFEEFGPAARERVEAEN